MAISKEQQEYFQHIIRGIGAGSQTCLMEMRERATGRVVNMICGVSPKEDDPTIMEFHPLAVMINPETVIEEYDPPIIASDDDFEGTH